MNIDTAYSQVFSYNTLSFCFGFGSFFLYSLFPLKNKQKNPLYAKVLSWYDWMLLYSKELFD